jgi:hypothetical protein
MLRSSSFCFLLGLLLRWPGCRLVVIENAKHASVPEPCAHLQAQPSKSGGLGPSPFLQQTGFRAGVCDGRLRRPVHVGAARTPRPSPTSVPRPSRTSFRFRRLGAHTSCPAFLDGTPHMTLRSVQPWPRHCRIAGARWRTALDAAPFQRLMHGSLFVHPSGINATTRRDELDIGPIFVQLDTYRRREFDPCWCPPCLSCLVLCEPASLSLPPSTVGFFLS